MLIFLHTRAVNTDHIIEADFSPEYGDRARLWLTLSCVSAGSAGESDSYTLDNVRRMYTGDRAWGLWLALKHGSPNAADFVTLRHHECRNGHTAAPITEYRYAHTDDDEGVLVDTGGVWCARCGVTIKLPAVDPTLLAAPAAVRA